MLTILAFYRSKKASEMPILDHILFVEMFYLNTIEQVFLLVEQLDQIVVCLTNSRLLTGIPILAVFQNLRWNSNKTSLPSIFEGRYLK